jgi:hypothetical protein
MNNFFKEAWKEIPWQMKAIWAGGAIISLAFIGFIIWVIIKLMMHFKVI